ncbi:MAG: nitrilase-related carbon-nitrogen hydrolase, partial [Flavobacteriaceae bacterium]
MKNFLKVALAQIAPVWLDKKATIKKIEKTITEAANEKAELVVFGEALLPGYPFWLAYTEGAAWDLKVNKEIHAHYARNSIQVEAGELNTICTLAKEHGISIYLGIMERAKDRGGHSLYCSLVYIDQQGEIKSVHR